MRHFLASGENEMRRRLLNKWKVFSIIIVFLVSFQTFLQPVIAEESHDELFVLIGDSLMKAKEGDQAAVAENMAQFADKWSTVNKKDSKQAKEVDKGLKKLQSMLENNNVKKEVLSSSLSSLSSALVRFEEEQNPTDQLKEKEQVKQLLPLADTMKSSLQNGENTKLKSQYQILLNKWSSVETIVHDQSITTYGNVEKYMALVRIAITQDPADMSKARNNLDKLTDELNNFIEGKSAEQLPEDEYSLSDLTSLLTKAEEQISKENYQKASESLDEILTIWPMVEGDVQTRDSGLYSDIETKIPTAISLLNSEKVQVEKVSTIVTEINKRLAPLTSKTSYTFWDAALILLREGLEGLLIVATLLAFLRKLGQSSGQKWIWSGVVAGVIASAGLAIFINIVFSKFAAASSREYIEGLTGIVAVVMMLTVGAWLHNKSNIGNWNQYINQQLRQAVAKGSLMSFAVISFLSVFREGAETIIFYAGITPYISLAELAMGILLAIILLTAVGFVILKYSVKIPIRLFFRTATLLIYFLAFKILGISVHALQISNVIPTSTVEQLPFVNWLGLYPTWETTLTQTLLVSVIFFMTYLVKRKHVKKVISTNV